MLLACSIETMLKIDKATFGKVTDWKISNCSFERLRFAASNNL